MVLLKGKSESEVEQSKPAYTGKLPGTSTSIEVEAKIEAVVNGDEGEHITVRSKRGLPAGYIEIAICGAGDPFIAIVHADSLINALVCAKEREA